MRRCPRSAFVRVPPMACNCKQQVGGIALVRYPSRSGAQDRNHPISKKDKAIYRTIRTYPISFIFTAYSEIPDKEVGVLWEAVKMGMPRCNELDIYPFCAFQRWFPLPGQLPLRQLQLSGPASDADRRLPGALLEAPCPLLNELGISGTNLAASYAASLLSNAAKFASITNLRISLNEEADTEAQIPKALALFPGLQELRLYGGFSHEEVAPIPLSLPNLDRLELHRHAMIRAFSLLSAPRLQHLALVAYPEENPTPAHWALLRPPQFPNLRSLRCETEDQDMHLIVDCIQGHPHLRDVHWEIQAQSAPQSIAALSSLVLKASHTQPLGTLLPQLDWFSITLSIAPEARKELCAQVAYQLEVFAVTRDAIPARVGRSSNFA